MRKKTNCPNCGAPINSTVCPYCGTAFYDFATLDHEKPTYIQVNVNGQVLIFRARVADMAFRVMCADELPTFDASFVVYPDDDGTVLKKREQRCFCA